MAVSAYSKLIDDTFLLHGDCTVQRGLKVISGARIIRMLFFSFLWIPKLVYNGLVSRPVVAFCLLQDLVNLSFRCFQAFRAH